MNISWILPSDLLLECIDFIINTNASALSSTTNSSVLITRQVEDPADAIYTVSIAAMDKAEEQENKVKHSASHFKVSKCTYHLYTVDTVAPRILKVHSYNICSSTITIQWTF